MNPALGNLNKGFIMSQSLFTDVVQIGVVVKDADAAVAHYR
jgi:hypothetical protein